MIFLLFVSSSLCEDLRKFPENTADISSINNLAYKSPISLDPKIRKALLNVLNRLEEQEKSDDVKSNEEKILTPDDVKWEYKANDTFKEYNYYEIVQDDPSPSSSSFENKKRQELIVDEPGALFFQIPRNNEPEPEKQESLNPQETKNALSQEVLFGNTEPEQRKSEPKLQKVSNSTIKKNEITENDVEVFQAPLLTAFTLEQDERGLPRRIIPLDKIELNSILENKIVPEPTETRRAREQTAREQTAREQQTARGIDIATFLQNEQKRYHLELESQFQELQERKRLLELEKQRLYVEQEKARRFKQALESRQREDFLRSINQNEILRQEVALQKSIPLEIHNKPVILPQIQFPQLQPQIGFPDAVDRQLQSLFQRSGIIQGKPQEDLNIVSKVLALNYGEDEKPKVTTERLNVPEELRNKRKLKDNLALNEKTFVLI